MAEREQQGQYSHVTIYSNGRIELFKHTSQITRIPFSFELIDGPGTNYNEEEHTYDGRKGKTDTHTIPHGFGRYKITISGDPIEFFREAQRLEERQLDGMSNDIVLQLPQREVSLR